MVAYDAEKNTQLERRSLVLAITEHIGTIKRVRQISPSVYEATWRTRDHAGARQSKVHVSTNNNVGRSRIPKHHCFSFPTLNTTHADHMLGS